MRVLVVLADGFEEVEALAPADVLRRAGATVIFAGLNDTFAVSSHNVKVAVDIHISQADLDGYDAIVLPGGMPGAVNLAASAEVSKRILNHYSIGKIVAAICASPAVVLGPLGILDNHKAVCYPGMENRYPDAKFGQQRVLRDGNVITARGAGCSLEFGLEIAKALFGEETASKVASSMVCRESYV